MYLIPLLTSYWKPKISSSLLFQSTPRTNYILTRMESSRNDEITHEFFPFFKVFKDGRVERFVLSDTQKILPSDDPRTGVRSKDVVISSEPPVSARIFLPQIPEPNRKLPLLLYIHGGGFSIESAFNAGYHKFVSALAAKAEAIAVSVEYRLAPEHPIPACYEDSWAALQWVASHANGDGPDPWLNNHADLRRAFLAGDSAGANISHHLAVRLGSCGLPGVKLFGMALVHPYFGGTEDDKMWLYMCPENRGLEDPKLKPAAEDLAGLGCERVLIFVAAEDHLRERGTALCVSPLLNCTFLLFPYMVSRAIESIFNGNS
ncbi:hypothetical protein I3760_06G144900 [Carya illinoinensis]|nr:hypothetical protein I3760_06G144900 [Carya illinoinensis]